MEKRHHASERFIRKLEDGERRLTGGLTVEEACTHLEITPSTWFGWHNDFGGPRAEEAKRLKELEKENGRLKRIIVDRAPAVNRFKKVAGETPDPEPPTGRG
ncbi:MAG TPA: transposase [Acidimicrobiales bacterium]|nr:transposase [Acidimicrobiales bacterium]